MRSSMILMLTLAGCGANPAKTAWKAEQSAKGQAAMAQCDAGLEQHSAYMNTTPPKAASGEVAEAWSVQQEAKIQGALEACKPAMRMGLTAKWFVVEVRQGEAYEKLMVELAAYYDAVSVKEKPAVLRRLIDAVNQAKAHYEFAIQTAEANPSVAAQNSGMLGKAKLRVPQLQANYAALKATQAKQYE